MQNFYVVRSFFMNIFIFPFHEEKLRVIIIIIIIRFHLL
jgi:hypothetical protein